MVLRASGGSVARSGPRYRLTSAARRRGSRGRRTVGPAPRAPVECTTTRRPSGAAGCTAFRPDRTMHDVLRQRLLRKIESLPDEQIYQVLDFIEFLESKYARRRRWRRRPAEVRREPGGQAPAEGGEPRHHPRGLPAHLGADRVLSGVSSAGKQILSELSEALEGPAKGSREPAPEARQRRVAANSGEGPGSARRGPGDGGEPRAAERPAGPLTLRRPSNILTHGTTRRSRERARARPPTPSGASAGRARGVSRRPERFSRKATDGRRFQPPAARIIKEGLTFDDVLLIPDHSLVHPKDTDVSSRVTRNIRLPDPSACRRPWTRSPSRSMAIQMAREGGMGIIHKNLTPERQAEEVDRVKRSESGMILNPITLTPGRHAARRAPPHGALLHQRRAHRGERRAPGGHHHQPGPPVRDGAGPAHPGGDDLRGARDGARWGPPSTRRRKLLHRHRIEKLPVVDADGNLQGPHHGEGHLQAPAVPRTRARTSTGVSASAPPMGASHKDLERAALLVEAGVDVLVVDTAHGHSEGVLRGRGPRAGALPGRASSSAATWARPRRRRPWWSGAPTR